MGKNAKPWQDYTDDQRRELVERYEGCRTVAEKYQLAQDLGLRVAQLYNLYSRWHRRGIRTPAR